MNGELQIKRFRHADRALLRTHRGRFPVIQHVILCCDSILPDAAAEAEDREKILEFQRSRDAEEEENRQL